MAVITDPIADLFARLKNAQGQHHKTVVMPASNMKKAILAVLESEGYILGTAETTDERGRANLEVSLKYHMGQPVITRLSRVSKPGHRIYSPAQEIPKVANGLGVTIISTSQGVLSDTKAREMNIGGEILGQVF